MTATLTRTLVERPLLMSAPMVRATFDGSKTQTRRVVTLPRSWPAAGYVIDDRAYADPGLGAGGYLHVHRPFDQDGAVSDTFQRLRCPYGDIGDRLWVRETHIRSGDDVMYADHADYDVCYPWKGSALNLWRVVPSIFMPRDLSRLTLELTGVRVERVQDIGILDAHAEGVDEWGHGLPTERERDEQRNRTAVENYARLWDSLNAKRGYGWDVNPWVWALSFTQATS